MRSCVLSEEKEKADDPIEYNNSDKYGAELAGQKLLLGFLEEYAEKGEAIQVNFRKLVSWVPYGERASHMIHLYPAKLLPHIPIFFLSNDMLSKEGDLVLDPFSGSGTVLLEAMLAGRKSVGADSNPLARLISEVKTTPIPLSKLKAAFKRLKIRISVTDSNGFIPDVINIDYWFYPHVKEQLGHIRRCILAMKNKELKSFFLVAFSNLIKRVSLADPRLSVPVRIKKEKYTKNSVYYSHAEKLLAKLEKIDVYKEFYKLVEKNIKRMEELLDKVDINVSATNIYSDARNLKEDDQLLYDESVQLIITSPPYAGAQKYIRSSGLNMGWLGQCSSTGLREFEKKNIGREHHSKTEYKEFVSCGLSDADKTLRVIYGINPLRSFIASKYLVEMRAAILEAYRVLRKGGYFVLVSSSNSICEVDFPTHKYLCVIAKDIGFQVKLRLIDDIHSRGLMTKRNKTAGIISCEWVYVFYKEVF